MSGPSLYRRHRPRTFADVVGQEHIVRTLSNAIEQGKVHHAYLFVGSRGTGKTSMAKILAAALNCEQGPTVEPCGQCESCRTIAVATSLDVIEMDAASNNSVDDIRELREAVAFAPAAGRYKVYILDEAHMLTTQAWNAFLKTLEEPPPNTVFVLATTEAQKVLPTVVDRCHRFDFGRPSAGQITEVLKRVATLESVEISDEAIALIARSATGSFRDALGTLEQLLTYSGTAVALDDVLAVLGVADAELLFKAVDAVVRQDPKQALEVIADLASSGSEVRQFVRDLEAHVRELMVVQILGKIPTEIAVAPERDQRLAQQAAQITANDVVRLLDRLADAQSAIKDGADARVQLELALIKAADPHTEPALAALQTRIERLESGGTTQHPADEPEPEPEPTPIDEPDTVAEIDREVGAVLDLWPAVIDQLRTDSVLLATLLKDARPVTLNGEQLSVAFPSSAAFLKRKAEDRANKAALTAALQVVTGHSFRLEYELSDELTTSDPAQSDQLTEEELVEHLMAEFDAEEIEASDERVVTTEE